MKTISLSTKKIMFFAIAMLLLLSACQPAQPTQTQEVVDIDAEIATAVALTVAAQNAQTQAALSLTPEATNTPLPTQTEAVPATPTLLLPTLLPTATPSPVLPPTSPGISISATPKPKYACDIIRRRPFDNAVFRPNDEFDIRWTIVNTGTRNLRAGTDVKYFSGPNMTSETFRELPEMEPGDQFELIFDAEAPSRQGFHVMTWTVEGQLCFPYVAIIVEK